MTDDPHAAMIAELRTCNQVAELFGITPGRVRQLAQRRGVGHKIGREIIFTPADVAALQPGKPGIRPTVVLS